MGIRYVIGGESQCSLFAETCSVADCLQQNLPNFSYERIEKSVAEWNRWLSNINEKNKWHHSGSPIVWKELLMDGSKPFYIGSVSDFFEYCHSYYKLDIYLPSGILEKLSDTYKKFQIKLKQNIRSIAVPHNIDVTKSVHSNVNICISGAGNPLSIFIISGLLDHSKKISKIYISDQNCSKELMKLIENECNYIKENCVKVKYVNKIGSALVSTHLLIILDYFPMRSTYSMGEWLHENKKIMDDIAITINATAPSKMCIVLPNLGPACYNATILAATLTNINKNNIVVTSSDLGMEVASIIADIAEVPLRNMFGPPVWGFIGVNHLVDSHTTIHKYNTFDPYERHTRVRYSTLPIGIIKPEMRTMEYLLFKNTCLWKIVAERKSLKKKSDNPISINKALAIVDLIKHWLFEPNPSKVISLGIQCNGAFDLTFKGVFSQPAHLIKGEWQPVCTYFLPKDPQMQLLYLEQIAKIIMTLRITDLPQIVPNTQCICRVKQFRDKNYRSKTGNTNFFI